MWLESHTPKSQSSHILPGGLSSTGLTCTVWEEVGGTPFSVSTGVPVQLWILWFNSLAAVGVPYSSSLSAVSYLLTCIYIVYFLSHTPADEEEIEGQEITFFDDDESE